MTTAFYRNGTVAVTQGSKVVTGTGTNWATGATKPLAGDVFIFKNKIYEVEHVISNTEIRLFRNFEDATATAQTYVIMRNASLNISSRIAAQVAQVVNQKQIMLDEFHEFLTNNTDPTVNLTDTLGNQIPVTPIPMLDASHNQAIKDLNDKADQVISSNILMSESEARAIQWQNENVNFDASGMVNTGKHIGSSSYPSVNEGINVSTAAATYSNKFILGSSYSQNLKGSSKTNFAVTHIAGAVCNILQYAPSASELSHFYLPEPEDGARVTDSTGNVRGSGKASLDLKVDVDPKYGNVPTGSKAQILREAQGRAFEGQCKNGDFRQEFGNGWTGLGIISNGLLTIDNSGGGGNAITPQSELLDETGDYEIIVDVLGVAGTVDMVCRTAGSRFSVLTLTEGINSNVYTLTSTTPNPNIYFQTAAGASVQVRSVQWRKITEEVVTHRVDVAAWEYYEEELTGRQEVMECLGSTSTTFGTTSVPTVLSTRKLSYFQQYDGQFPEVTANPDFINDRFRCVVWPDLTEPQKREIAAYMGEKLFKGVNEFPVNGRLRPRTIRGTGNGDWFNIDSNAHGGLGPSSFLSWGNNKNIIHAQGVKDTAPRPDGNWSDGFYVGVDYADLGQGAGVFASADTNGSQLEPSAAYKGRCFLYVVATVPRANKAAYVEGMNDFGTGMLQSKRGTGFSEVWYASNAVEVNTLQDTFTMVAPNTGAIGQLSGHPDGIFYDGIEAGGLNGVIDWRLSAYPMDTKEEASKVFGKVVNGAYRGLEKLVWTQVSVANQVATSGSTAAFDDVVPSNLNGLVVTGQNAWLEQADGAYVKVTINSIFGSGSSIGFTPSVQGRKADSKAIFTVPLNLSVSGEFSTQMVIADPANFLKVFPNGILGTWCPVIPDGVKTSFQFSKKALGSNLLLNLRTSDNGATWASVSTNFDAVLNNKNVNWSTGDIVISSYKAFASQTVQSTNKPVLNGSEGLGDVFATSSSAVYYGVLLQESLTGNIGKHNQNKEFKLNKFLIDRNGNNAIAKFADTPPEHTQIDIAAPINNSPAVKALWYQTSDNGQVGLNFAYNELVWGAPVYQGVFETNTEWVAGELYRVQDSLLGTRKFYKCMKSTSLPINSTSFIKQADGSIKYDTTGVTYFVDMGLPQGWGDDSTVRIVDGQGTYNNLNGDVCLYGSNELALPMGWVSNHARVGTQVPGVDL